MIEYLNGSSKGKKEIKSKGTLAEYWLGCPLLVGEHKIGAIVVQSYEKKHIITNDDRDLLGFVSDLSYSSC